MKKSLLLVLAVPALLLTSCGGGVNVNGYISNGTSITEQTIRDVENVAEAKREEINQVVNKGVTAKGRNLTEAKVITEEGSSTEVTDLTLDMAIGFETPSLSIKLSGNVSASIPGQSASGSATGVSEATKASGSWVVSQDYLTISMNGQSQTRTGYLFGRDGVNVEAYYQDFVNGTSSWDFDFNFEEVKQVASKYGLGDLFDNIAISGDPKTGSFEIGLSKEYNNNFVGGSLKFNKFRFAYEDYLMKEYAIRFESTNISQYGTAIMIVEQDFVFTYDK